MSNSNDPPKPATADATAKTPLKELTPEEKAAAKEAARD